MERNRKREMVHHFKQDMAKKSLDQRVKKKKANNLSTSKLVKGQLG